MATSCGMSNSVTRESQYAKMYEEKPVTLLVMPPINNSANVEAKELLYTSISRPLVEAGYYVISPLLAMDVLKAESAYDAEMFFDAPLTPFRNYFGADAVVFSVIDTWTKKGMGIETKIRYVIKSAHTHEILFDRSCDLYLDLSVNSESKSALGALINLAASVIKFCFGSERMLFDISFKFLTEVCKAAVSQIDSAIEQVICRGRSSVW